MMGRMDWYGCMFIYGLVSADDGIVGVDDEDDEIEDDDDNRGTIGGSNDDGICCVDDDDGGSTVRLLWVNKKSISLLFFSLLSFSSAADNDDDDNGDIDVDTNNACSRRHDATTATEKEAEDPKPAPKGKPCDRTVIDRPNQ